MPVLNLSRIKFYEGPKRGEPALEITPGAVTVFVGPNNAGKSLAIREIENWCYGKDVPRKVIDEIDITMPADENEANTLLQEFTIPVPINQIQHPGHIWVGQYSFRPDAATRQFQVELGHFRDLFNAANSQFREFLVAFYCTKLDGKTRFSLSEPKPRGDLQLKPTNHLSAIFVNDAARAEIRQIVAEALGTYFVIDPTGENNLRIRLSNRAPADNDEEQSLSARARTFHSNATLIAELSDGVQCFVGLISAVFSLPHKIILIDEPEAFLHPPLARRLGTELTKVCEDRESSLVVSTHSSDFLSGCLETTRNISIVRLTYENAVGTARSLLAADIENITKDPLLRSTGVLRALFHHAAVITESDTDRVFYEEMNTRLVDENRGARDTLFLNAQNKQTIRRIVEPLRKIGVPAVGIVDLDVLKSRADLEALCTACQVPTATFPDIELERDHFNTLLVALPANGYKKVGINGLAVADKARAVIFLNSLKTYGLYIVPCGELETWLSSFGISHMKGVTWLNNMFTLIGGVRDDANYLQPNAEEIWTFMSEIAVWVNNANRLGV